MRITPTSSRLRAGFGLLLLSFMLMGRPDPATAGTPLDELVECYVEADRRFMACIENKGFFGRLACSAGHIAEGIACAAEFIDKVVS